MTADRTVLRAGSPELDDLLDDLDRPDDWQERPVIVEVTNRYVVWVDADRDIRRMQGDYELIERGDYSFDGAIVVSEPDRYDWYYVYDPDGDDIGPENAPVQGPTWNCPELYCGGHQPAWATWDRRHGPRCPHHVPAGAGQ